MKGKTVLQSVRLHATFYGKRGQFIGKDAQVDGNTIVLTRSRIHGYLQFCPEERHPGDGEWDKMPRGEREMTETQTLDYRVSITETNGNVSLDVEIKGVPEIPVSMELSFRHGGKLSGTMPHKQIKDVFFFKTAWENIKWARM